jgi:hypothetical protein
MATRLEVLEDKKKSIEDKALVLHEMFCKAIHRISDDICPSRCDVCLKALEKGLSEDVGEDFGK